MTPAARIAAAIEILDAVLTGDPAERHLTDWGRRNRFAGSGDRAAIRDHVFDALRCRRSYAWLGGSETGRGLMVGALRAAGTDPATVFTGDGYAPKPLRAEEQPVSDLAEAPMAVRLDCPDWLFPVMSQSLGAQLEPVLASLRHRAPVFLRVNQARASLDQAEASLAAEAVLTRRHKLAPWALEVIENPRRVQTSRAYLDGLVELQDAASQAVCAALPARGKVLDYCAGGGGKALALAAAGAQVFAHDAAAARMRDLPGRARRAGVAIPRLDPADLGSEAPFDLVLCDAPCSGSGTWRRAPGAKWNFAPQDLEELNKCQDEILRQAAPLVAPGGVLAYATCSLLEAENGDRVAAFQQDHPGWTLMSERRLTPLDGADGFFWAHLRSPEPLGQDS